MDEIAVLPDPQCTIAHNIKNIETLYSNLYTENFMLFDFVLLLISKSTI